MAMTRDLPDDLTAALKYFDEHNATYVIAENTTSDGVEYWVYFGHYSTIEYYELVKLWHNASLEYDYPIKACVPFDEYEQHALPIVYGDLSDFDKFPASLEAIKEEDKKIEKKEALELLEIKYKKDYSLFPLRVLTFLIAVGLQGYLLYAWLTRASQQTAPVAK